MDVHGAKSENRNPKSETDPKLEARSEPADAAPRAGDPQPDAPASERFDLEERPARFGEAVIGFATRVPVTPVTSRLIAQLVGAGTSVGANYAEASDAESRRDFQHKIGICRKEARETKHWLRMCAVAAPDLASDARTLWREAKELNLIFGAMTRQRRRP